MTLFRLDFGYIYSAKSSELTGEKKNARKWKEFSASNCMEMNAYNISLFYCLTDRGCYNICSRISLKIAIHCLPQRWPPITTFHDKKRLPKKEKNSPFIEFLVAFNTSLWLSHPPSTHLKNTEQSMYAC